MGEVEAHECYHRETPLGPATLVRFQHRAGVPVGFRQLWEAFAETYPDRWAVQAFPPRDRLLDGANKYWLWVLNERPESLDLVRDTR